MRTPLLCTALLLATAAFAQPLNDACSTAATAACGSALSGTTVDATDDAAEDCGTAISAPGVWYSFVGNDQQVVFSTCPDEEFDTKLNVYSGSCGALACVAGNDDAGPGVLCSTVAFWAATGTTYYILVQGYDGETGAFNLSITCSDATEDICQGAIPVACDATVDGTTEGAGADGAPFCGTSITAPGVWHSVIGTGGQMVVSTCPDEAYDTKLNVYTGPCDALQCVDGNDDANPDVLCSTVTFMSVLGQEYFVLVQGYNGDSGPYTLSVSCPVCGSPGNIQIIPTDVEASITWTSPNTSSSFQVEYGPVGFTPGSGTVVTGVTGLTGPPVNIEDLLAGTAYDVYVTEVCDAGSSPLAGPVSFTTLSEPPAVNAFCSGALPIDCGGSVNGDTGEGILTPAPECGSAYVSAPGLWYAFTGTGDDMTLSTCSGSGYDTKISVFTGSCTAPVCVAGNDDGPNCPGNTSTATFQTQAGVEYLALVHGFGQDQGAFTLTLTCTPACAAEGNDDCAAATVLTVQPLGGCESSTGNNTCAFAPAVPNPPCDPYANIVDVWYAFNSGGGTEHVLIIEAGSAQMVHAAVYEACADPTYVLCEIEITDALPLSGLEPNTDYLVRVWNGGGTEAGTFSICVEANLNLSADATAAGHAVVIHPNPAAERFAISGAGRFSELRLIDAAGRTAWTHRPTGDAIIQVPASGLLPGAYLVLADGRPLGRVMISR